MPDRLDTLLAHAGFEPETPTRAVVPPLHLATTFERDEHGESGAFVYGREANPNRAQFESLLARLEGGEQAFAFASGMAAIAATFQLLEPGSHVILPQHLYYGVRHVMSDLFERWNLDVSYVDMGSANLVREAMRDETRMLWIETPSNPLLRITDIAAVCRMARERNALVAVDGTWTTPLIQRPFELGADLVVHSATKYLSGHSDVLAGAVIVPERSKLAAPLRSIQTAAGAVLEPFSCWLAMRGMRTLALRLERQCDNAEAMARFLDAHPRVTAVHFPGLAAHPGHEIAVRQMKRFGGMLSFEIDGTPDDARRIAAGCRILRNATSLGGTESLIEHRASVERAGDTPPTLLRISAGIESESDLLDDLSRSLAA